jgi:hypothetical protein
MEILTNHTAIRCSDCYDTLVQTLTESSTAWTHLYNKECSFTKYENFRITMKVVLIEYLQRNKALNMKCVGCNFTTKTKWQDCTHVVTDIEHNKEWYDVCLMNKCEPCAAFRIVCHLYPENKKTYTDRNGVEVFFVTPESILQILTEQNCIIEHYPSTCDRCDQMKEKADRELYEAKMAAIDKDRIRRVHLAREAILEALTEKEAEEKAANTFVSTVEAMKNMIVEKPKIATAFPFPTDIEQASLVKTLLIIKESRGYWTQSETKLYNELHTRDLYISTPEIRQHVDAHLNGKLTFEQLLRLVPTTPYSPTCDGMVVTSTLVHTATPIQHLRLFYPIK